MNKPEIYDDVCQFEIQENITIVKEYFPYFRWSTRNKVIDIGTATGQFTTKYLRPMLPNVEKLIGVDVDVSMIAHAAKLYTERRCEYKVLDIEKELPIDFVGQFDQAFSFFCLQWIVVENQGLAMQNIYKLLKPTGGVFASIFASSPFYYAYEEMAKTAKWKPYKKDLKKFISPYHNMDHPEKVVRTILEKTNFKVHVCDLKPGKYNHGSREDLKRFNISVNPFYDSIPNELKQDYLNDIVNEICKKSNNEDEENIVVPFDLVVFYATKN